MYAAARRRRGGGGGDYWPGFVDVLSSLLLVLIFLLVVYMLAQYFLQRTLSGQSEALDELTRQVTELSDMLSLERQANADLRLNIAQISAELQSSISTRDQLTADLTGLRSERDTLKLQLEDATAEAIAANEARTAAETVAAEGETQIRALLADVERLKRDIASLQAVRTELESKVSQLAATLDDKNQQVAALDDAYSAARDLTRELEARLASEEERTALAQAELSEREVALRELQGLYLNTQTALDDEQNLSKQQNDQIAILNQQILSLRDQLARIEQALDTSEADSREQQVIIADLGKRLNLALAAKVEELAEYRSEFFGRLREVLADRKDFTIIGDRFVFQSEVLFGSGSADLGPAGQQRLATFAGVLKEVMARIPTDLPWILQVDGHTDKNPIRTARFPSNWELSAARAISVVNSLIQQGIPPNRLSATGYGEFQPLDSRDDEIGYRRNRRIELKLTQR